MTKKMLIAVLVFILASLLIMGCDLFVREYELQIAVMPEGGGTVTPEGGSFAANTVVDLEVNPAEYWLFDRWGGANSDDVVLDEGIYKITMDDDKAITAIFVQMSTVATPNIDPAGGDFNEEVTVNITTTTEDATIHYTLDGSVPSPTHGELFTEPFVLAEATTVKAIAFKENMIPSEVETAVFDIDIPFWELMGSAGFSLGAASYNSLAQANGTIYVAFQDQGAQGKATVMEYSGGDWIPLGEAGFTTGTAENLSLFSLADQLYLAFIDGDQENKVTVMTYQDGWKVVGDAGFTPVVSQLDLYGYEEKLYVAFVEDEQESKGDMRYYDLTDGLEGAWQIEMAHAPISQGAVADIKIVHNGDTMIIGYIDLADNAVAKLMEFVPGDDFMLPPRWVAYHESTPFPVTEFDMLFCDLNDEIIMGFSDEFQDNKATVMTYEEGSIVGVGQRGFSSAAVASVTLSKWAGAPLIAYADQAYDFAPVVQVYTAEAWQTVGEKAFTQSATSFLDLLVKDGTAYLALSDEDNDDKLSVYRFTAPVF